MLMLLPAANVIGGLLVFRAVYFLVPLAIPLLLFRADLRRKIAVVK